MLKCNTNDGPVSGLRIRTSLALPPSLLLPLLIGGCGATVSGSEKLADVDATSLWAERLALPVEVHGALPSDFGETLTSLFPRPPARQYASAGPTVLPGQEDRIVLFVNAAVIPPKPLLCSLPANVQTDTRSNERASVTAALCRGSEILTQATGSVPVRGQSTHDLRQGFGVVEDALFDALQPPEHDSQDISG